MKIPGGRIAQWTIGVDGEGLRDEDRVVGAPVPRCAPGINPRQSNCWRIHFDAVWQRFDEAGNWQEVDSPFFFEGMTSQEKVSYGVASLTIATFDKAERRLRSAETLVRQARLAVALERFHRRHSAYPGELQELTPALLSTIPTDPADGEPMRYEAESPTRYRLWSNAEEFVESGKQGEGKESTVEVALKWPGAKPSPRAGSD